MNIQDFCDKYSGKVIKFAFFGTPIGGINDLSKFILIFEDGSKISIYNDTTSGLWKQRSMTSGDDITDLNGNKLKHIMPKISDTVIFDDDLDKGDIDNSVHETMFIEVATDKNFITLISSVEHNGLHDSGLKLIIEKEASK